MAERRRLIVVGGKSDPGPTLPGLSRVMEHAARGARPAGGLTADTPQACLDLLVPRLA